MVSGHADPAAVTVLTIGGSTLAAIFVAMRMYARFRVAKNAGWDDGFIVGSVVSCAHRCVVCSGWEQNLDDVA